MQDEVIVDSAEDDACSLEPTAGPCRALLPRYYFDGQDGKCKKFLYGGCSGNTNNFMTEIECMERCGVVQEERNQEVFRKSIKKAPHKSHNRFS